MKKNSIFRLCIIFILLFLLSACSINRIAVRMVANALSGSGSSTVFTGDNDPELVGDALPFALKMYESLLQSDPKNVKLLLTTGSGFISYANAFLQSPAELMDYAQHTEKARMLSQAGSLYRRGSSYISRALDIKHPGFTEKMDKGSWSSAFKDVSLKDVPFFYWKAAAILGEFSIDSFNPELMLHVPQGIAYLAESLSLDPDYSKGALDELLVSVFASMPDSLIYRANDKKDNFSVYEIFKTYFKAHGKEFDMLTNKERAQFYFNRAVYLSKGLKASPYVDYATTVCIKDQNYTQFKDYLQDALKIDINKDIPNRLVNVIAQRKARWYLAHSDDYFILP